MAASIKQRTDPFGEQPQGLVLRLRGQTVRLSGDPLLDWYCCPRFDAASVFAAILDSRRGGHFRIAPECAGWTSKQL